MDYRINKFCVMTGKSIGFSCGDCVASELDFPDSIDFDVRKYCIATGGRINEVCNECLLLNRYFQGYTAHFDTMINVGDIVIIPEIYDRHFKQSDRLTVWQYCPHIDSPIDFNFVEIVLFNEYEDHRKQIVEIIKQGQAYRDDSIGNIHSYIRFPRYEFIPDRERECLKEIVGNSSRLYYPYPESIEAK